MIGLVCICARPPRSSLSSPGLSCIVGFGVVVVVVVVVGVDGVGIDDYWTSFRLSLSLLSLTSSLSYQLCFLLHMHQHYRLLLLTRLLNPYLELPQLVLELLASLCTSARSLSGCFCAIQSATGSERIDSFQKSPLQSLIGWHGIIVGLCLFIMDIS